MITKIDHVGIASDFDGGGGAQYDRLRHRRQSIGFERRGVVEDPAIYPVAPTLPTGIRQNGPN